MILQRLSWQYQTNNRQLNDRSATAAVSRRHIFEVHDGTWNFARVETFQNASFTPLGKSTEMNAPPSGF